MKITPVQRTNQNFKATITFNPSKIASQETRKALVEGVKSILEVHDQTKIAGMFSPEKTSADIIIPKTRGEVIDKIIEILTDAGIPFNYSSRDRLRTRFLLKTEGRWPN